MAKPLGGGDLVGALPGGRGFVRLAKLVEHVAELLKQVGVGSGHFFLLLAEEAKRRLPLGPGLVRLAKLMERVADVLVNGGVRLVLHQLGGAPQLGERLAVLALPVVEPAEAVDVRGVVGGEFVGPGNVLGRLVEVAVDVRPHVAEVVHGVVVFG